MTAHDDDEYLLSNLADEFIQRLRRHEDLSLEEYVQRCPHLAEEIHELFPTLALMESTLDARGSVAARKRDRQAEYVGQHLGDYRIVREVGRGGMGVVYEAIQESLGRRVALKVLPAHHAENPQYLQRFRREACACARLHHTNIVPVFDVEAVDGVHFYTMQFIDGQPLNVLLEEAAGTSSALARWVAHWEAIQVARIAAWQQACDPGVETGWRVRSTHADRARLCDALVTDRRLPSARASPAQGVSRRVYYQNIARLGKQVADALAYAHREGVIHRDIKPHNLLLDSAGTLWITDFGLAQTAGQGELTSPGDVVGTLRYLPPERFQGQVDERGDIYSLGITLYEVLTRQSAFATSERAQLIDQILNTGPAPPRRIDRRIPQDLETIVLKAISRDANQRYQRAEFLAEDLDCFITERPIRARRLSVGGYAWRWCRRNKVLAGTIGLAAALLMAVLVVSLVDTVRIRKLLHETRAARRETRERLFDSLVSQAHARWTGSHRFGRRFQTLGLLQEARALASELDLPDDSLIRMRNEAIAAVCLPDEEIARVVAAFPVGSAVLDFDPRLHRYARGDVEGRVTVHRVSDNQLLHRLPTPLSQGRFATTEGVAFSPDGRYLHVRRLNERREESHLQLWNVSGDVPQVVFERSDQIVGATAFSPDGRQLGVLIRESLPAEPETLITSLHVLDLATGRDAAPPVTAGDATALIFHPTESQVAVSSPAAVRILQWTSGAEVRRWDRSLITPLAWSPNGQQLLARASIDLNIYRWDVLRQRELPPLATHSSDTIDKIVFGPQGNRFFSFSKFRYQVWDFRSGQLLWDSPQAFAATRISRDGNLLAGAYGGYPHIRILRLHARRELGRLNLASPVAEGFPRAILSRDGRIVAATARAGTVFVDVETQEELGVIPGDRLPLVFDTDASLLTHANAPEGVRRWPISIDSERPFQISIGAPVPLVEIQGSGATSQSLFAGLGIWSSSSDGRVIATPWQRDPASGATIFLAEADGTKPQQYRSLELGPQHDVRFTSISPDGKWVATGSTSWLAGSSQAEDSVTVWEASTGRRVKELLAGEGFPQFSSDGRWIAVTSGFFAEGVRVWRVGSWQPAPAPQSIESPSPVTVAFDAPSSLLAVQGHRIRLLVPETGRELALLSVSEETSLAPQCVTPDGRRLIAFGIPNGQLYLWDLVAIRRQLAQLGLDWDQPPSRPGS